MDTDEFKREVSDPARAYYDTVYNLSVAQLTEMQKELFDDWWFNRRPVPSDECFWKKTEVPAGYEKYTPQDIKSAHDSILYAACQGCG